MKKGSLIVLSGFAGSGKGTVVKRLVSKYDNFALSISMTTRSPRPGERDGVEYFFTTKEKFEDTIAEDGLIEYACYVGNYYGTPKKYVDEQIAAGKDVILEIEMQGALKIKEKFPESILVFMTPPSADELYRRLKGRGTETDEVIAKRMKRAFEESQGIKDYDYLVVNDDIDLCTTEVYNIVCAAKAEASRRKEFIEQINRELEKFNV